MATESKKHHFVTQAQLKHFSIKGAGRQIWVFDKVANKSWRSAIVDAGSENNFNTVGSGDEKLNFEEAFSDVDDRSAVFLQGIVSHRSLTDLGPEHHGAMLDLFATQMVRTHFARSSPLHMAEQLRSVLQQLGYNPDDDETMALPTDDDLRLGALKTFLERQQHRAAMLRLLPALFTPPDLGAFILSDHPVAVTNIYPYGDHGLLSHGIMLMLPIAPDLGLALVCPTIVAHYEAIDGIDMPADRRNKMELYRAGFRSGTPITILPEEVGNWNRMQVAQSRRFLYAATDSFDPARQLLSEHQELRLVKTHVELGGMGSPPPPRRGMPPGLQLVVKGRFDSCILELAEIDKTGEGLTARTENVALLASVAGDRNPLIVELYADGQQRRHMAQATLEIFGAASEGWFRAVHLDPSLRGLARQIDYGQPDRTWLRR